MTLTDSRFSNSQVVDHASPRSGKTRRAVRATEVLLPLCEFFPAYMKRTLVANINTEAVKSIYPLPVAASRLQKTAPISSTCLYP